MSGVITHLHTEKSLNVIVVVDWAYSERDHHRIGVRYFLECGFNVTVLNFCELTFPHVNILDSFEGDSSMKYVRIKNRTQFDLVMNSLWLPATVFLNPSQNPVLFSYISEMKQAGCQLVLVNPACHPVSGLSKSASRLNSETILKVLRNPWLVIMFLKRIFRGMAAVFPEVDVFCPGGEVPASLPHPLIGSNTRVIPIQSLDFDRMWEVEGKSLSELPERFAVFLDEYLPFHPDYDAMKIAAPLSGEQYYPNLRRIFDRIEEAYSCKVVIAAHPRAVYSEKQVQEWFGGRQVVFSETPVLVSDSILALAHASTSISYVILKNKPLLLIDSDRWIGSSMRAGIDSICAILGPKLVFLEGEEAVPVDLDSMILDPERLSRYRSDFIGSPAAKKCPSYWVLAAIVRGEL